MRAYDTTAAASVRSINKSAKLNVGRGRRAHAKMKGCRQDQSDAADTVLNGATEEKADAAASERLSAFWFWYRITVFA